MIIVGVCLAILASAIGTASKQMLAAAGHLRKPWLSKLGFGMNVAVGPFVDASAYAFAPQTIVVPFACLDVIFNAITAPYTLHWQQEQLTQSHILGTALVSAGAVLTSIFGQSSEYVFDVYELEKLLFFRPASVVYMAVELCVIFFVQLALWKNWVTPTARGIALGMIAGILMGNVFFTKGLVRIIRTGAWSAWLRRTSSPCVPWVVL